MTITYNHLNLPRLFTWTSGSFNGNSVEILYDAAGTKLKKTVKTGATVNYTQEYIGGIEYRDGIREAIYHAEGRVKYTSPSTTRYEYTIKDHLGNARISFSDLNGNGAVDFSSEVLQENHYYPFGLNMDGKWMNDAALDNKYQYNGKEWNDDFGLNLNDYGARWYDASVGRWWSVDKMSEHPLQVGISQYAYSFNNPANQNDPDGNCPICPVIYAGLKLFAAGFAIGAGADATVQVATNKIQGKDAFDDFSVSSTVISGVSGGLTAGTGSIGSVGVRTAINITISGAESMSKQVVTDESATAAFNGDYSMISSNASKINPVQVGSDMIMDAAGGFVNTVGKGELKAMERQVDRTSRIAENSPSSGRFANKDAAASRLNNAKNSNSFVQELTSNTMQSASNEYRSAVMASDNRAILGGSRNQVAQDATNYKVVLPIKH